MAAPTSLKGSNAELLSLLGKIRQQHIVPNLMPRTAQRLELRPKYASQLENSQQVIEIDGEDILLKARTKEDKLRTDRLKPMVKNAITLMHEGQEEDWQNFLPLLTRIHKAKQTFNTTTHAGILRKLADLNQVSKAMACVARGRDTGFRIARPEILTELLRAIRQDAMRNDWSEEALRTAMRRARRLAGMLESEQYGATKQIKSIHDPRLRPEVLGTFLELAAIYAMRHANKTDTDGAVRSAANRLLSILDKEPTLLKPRQWTAPAAGPVDDVLDSVPIWNGLRLAEKLLGNDMPHAALARQIMLELEAGLKKVVEETKQTRVVVEQSYGKSAVDMFEDCMKH